MRRARERGLLSFDPLLGEERVELGWVDGRRLDDSIDRSLLTEF
jgi:hypothetical protein